MKLLPFHRPRALQIIRLAKYIPLFQAVLTQYELYDELTWEDAVEELVLQLAEQNEILTQQLKECYKNSINPILVRKF